MNKQEILAVVALFALLIGWTVITGRQKVKEELETRGTNTTAQVVGGTNTQMTAGTPTNAVVTPVPENTETEVTKPVKPPVTAEKPEKPEELAVLSSDKAELTVTSWGGGVAAVKLLDYPVSAEAGSERVEFAYDHPGLSLGDIAGLGVGRDYEVVKDGDQVVVRRRTAEGLELERRYEFVDHYQLTVTDRFMNRGGDALAIPDYSLSLGAMPEINKSDGRTYGVTHSIDTLSAEDGKKVTQWGKQWNKLFGVGGGGLSCFRTPPPVDSLKTQVTVRAGKPVLWAAAKNRFFAQIVRPQEGAKDCIARADRDLEATNRFDIGTVSAELWIDGRVLPPQGSYTNAMSYYVGPMSFAELSKLDAYQDRLMLRAWRFWGWWRACCIGLLWLLNAIHAVIPSYGVAIIVLTILVKILMWPLTQKSNNNMKRMQQVQPLLSEVREKYKSNPQKMQQKTMEIYREHNVNPVAGCLPMFVQMPVFIALFTVLRSAVELRFAPFLWISDLSSPEGLIPNLVQMVPVIGPMAGSLNILPLAMTATMIWQQKLTPSSGDPQQKKMMMYMPVMFLFLFYKMSSALTLYWTVSQALSIAQLYWQNKSKDA